MINCKRRVAITGVGAVTPCGLDFPSTWHAVSHAVSGVREVTRVDPASLRSKVAGEVRNFDATRFFAKKDLPRVGRFMQLAMSAADEAVRSSGLSHEAMSDIERERFGVLVGSSVGAIEMVEQVTVARRVPSTFYPSYLINVASGMLAIHFGYRGPGTAISTACATGAHAVGEGARLIGHGYADRMLVGATEAALTPVGMEGFDSMKALSRAHNDAPERASRPFDQARDGFVMSEGAAVMVLEEWELARARGAKVYAEIVGYGMSLDAHHVTAPHPNGEGAARAMLLALADAGLPAGAVGYVNAHGTSTKRGDLAEALAVRQVFRESIKTLKVSSTKSCTGHLLGAAGSLEALFTAQTLESGIVPPTMNLEHQDPECDFDVTPNHPSELKTDFAMSNSFAFGGMNASLLLRRDPLS